MQSGLNYKKTFLSLKIRSFKSRAGYNGARMVYEVVLLPKIFVHILGNATTPYIHSEIFWPLAEAQKDNNDLQFHGKYD